MATFDSVHGVTDHTGIPGVGAPSEITDIPTAETDTSLVLAPDGAGGVEWAVPGGGFTVGTSFPGSPTDNDLCLRTDLPCEWYRYESTGSMWLCTVAHELPLSIRTLTTGISATATIANMPSLASGGDIYIRTFRNLTFVTTTSSGTQYWTMTLDKGDTANPTVYTNIGSVSTISNTADIWVEESTAVNAIVVGATYPVFRVVATKTSTPGNLVLAMSVTYSHVFDV